MKYSVYCPNCGASRIEARVKPKFCPECGGELSAEEFTPKSSVARRRAELAMERLDELLPQLEEAWARYARLSVEYEDERQVLCQYRKRGHVSDEEVKMYTKNGFKKVSLNDALKEYRANRKNGEGTDLK